MFSFPFLMIRLFLSSLLVTRFTLGSSPFSTGDRLNSSVDFQWLVRLSFWLDRLQRSFESRSGNILSQSQESSFQFCRKSSSSLSLSTVLNYSMPVMQVRSMRLLLLFLMATSRLTVFTQSKNHSFISLSQTSIFLFLSFSDSLLVLASDPNLYLFSNCVFLLFSSLNVYIFLLSLLIYQFFLASYAYRSSFLDSSMDLFMPDILNDLICSRSCSSTSICCFSIYFILLFKCSFSCVMASSFEYNFNASSLNITISFQRYWMRSLEENIFSCSSDLCFISASSFLIFDMWLRQAYKNSASCFLMTCSTFLSMSSMALLRSRYAQNTG